MGQSQSAPAGAANPTTDTRQENVCPSPPWKQTNTNPDGWHCSVCQGQRKGEMTRFENPIMAQLGEAERVKSLNSERNILLFQISFPYTLRFFYVSFGLLK